MKKLKKNLKMNHTFGTYPFNISSKIKHFHTCLLLFFVFLFITLALTLAGLILILYFMWFKHEP